MKGVDKEAGKMKPRKWTSGDARITKDVFKTSQFSSHLDGRKKTTSLNPSRVGFQTTV